MVRNRSASAPRASRERSCPARKASGTLTSEHAVTHSSTSERSPDSRSLVSSVANISSVSAPAMLGSSARRRGADAFSQR